MHIFIGLGLGLLFIYFLLFFYFFYLFFIYFLVYLFIFFFFFLRGVLFGVFLRMFGGGGDGKKGQVKLAIHFCVFSVCVMHTANVQKSKDYKIAPHTLRRKWHLWSLFGLLTFAAKVAGWLYAVITEPLRLERNLHETVCRQMQTN